MASKLTIQQGVDSLISWPVEDDDSPANLTGYTAQMQVRSKMDSASDLLAVFNPTCSGANVNLHITAEQTYEFTWKRGYSTLVLIDPDGVPRDIVWSGVVTLSLIATRVVVNI